MAKVQRVEAVSLKVQISDDGMSFTVNGGYELQTGADAMRKGENNPLRFERTFSQPKLVKTMKEWDLGAARGIVKPGACYTVTKTLPIWFDDGGPLARFTCEEIDGSEMVYWDESEHQICDVSGLAPSV